MDEQDFESLVASYRDNLKYDAKDEDLLFAIDKAIQESRILKEVMDKIAVENKKYWKHGTSVDMSQWHPSKARVINNRIFTDIETAIPIITSEVPEATVIGDLTTNAIKETIKKGLQYAYEVKFDFQTTLQKLIRSWYLQQIGILKYGWGEEGGFYIEKKLSRNIGFDKTANTLDDSEFVWELVETKLGDLIDKFGKQKEIETAVGNTDRNTKVRYIEFWGGNGKWYVCKLNDLILKKGKNPNWDYGEKAKEAVIGEDGVEITPTVPAKEGENILSKPEFPYILFNVFNLGDDHSVYDDTGVIQQCIPLQENVNKGKQQISDLNEGQKRVWVLSGVEDKIAQSLVNETGDLLIKLQNGNVKEQVGQVQAGKPDAGMFNDVADSLQQIDNIIGMHSTTRGERSEPETLGGRKLLKGADIGRLDLIVRNVEQVVEKWWTAYLHMIKVYSDGGEVLRTEDDKVELKSEDIPSDIKIMVKRGSTLPTDEASRFDMAKELATAGLIDPATLFEEMGYGNADKRVNDLYRWLALTGKIDMAAVQATQGMSNNPEGDQAAQRIQKIVGSPAFQQLSPEEQQQKKQELSLILNKVKK